jgi:hypothetical protein
MNIINLYGFCNKTQIQKETGHVYTAPFRTVLSCGSCVFCYWVVSVGIDFQRTLDLSEVSHSRQAKVINTVNFT